MQLAAVEWDAWEEENGGDGTVVRALGTPDVGGRGNWGGRASRWIESGVGIKEDGCQGVARSLCSGEPGAEGFENFGIGWYKFHRGGYRVT